MPLHSGLAPVTSAPCTVWFSTSVTLEDNAAILSRNSAMLSCYSINWPSTCLTKSSTGFALNLCCICCVISAVFVTSSVTVHYCVHSFEDDSVADWYLISFCWLELILTISFSNLSSLFWTDATTARILSAPCLQPLQNQWTSALNCVRTLYSTSEISWHLLWYNWLQVSQHALGSASATVFQAYTALTDKHWLGGRTFCHKLHFLRFSWL